MLLSTQSIQRTNKKQLANQKTTQPANQTVFKSIVYVYSVGFFEVTSEPPVNNLAINFSVQKRPPFLKIIAMSAAQKDLEKHANHICFYDRFG